MELDSHCWHRRCGRVFSAISADTFAQSYAMVALFQSVAKRNLVKTSLTLNSRIYHHREPSQMVHDGPDVEGGQLIC